MVPQGVLASRCNQYFSALPRRCKTSDTDNRIIKPASFWPSVVGSQRKFGCLYHVHRSYNWDMRPEDRTDLLKLPIFVSRTVAPNIPWIHGGSTREPPRVHRSRNWDMRAKDRTDLLNLPICVPHGATRGPRRP